MTFRLFAAFTVLLTSLVACQEGFVEIINPPPENVLTMESEVVGLIQQATQSDGSVDNIVDGASCTLIQLPFTVSILGLEIEINSEDDLEIIEAVFDEFDTDTDSLAIFFPITVLLADHSQVTINNLDELEDITKDCIENGDDEDIECVDFQYPINASFFNTVNQTSGVETFSDDQDLYEFLNNLQEGDLVGISFPVTMILADGTLVVVEDNDDIGDVITSNSSTCDEDDDNDFDDDDDPDNPELVGVLLNGFWMVSNFNKDGVDETDDFEAYSFEFKADGTASATLNTNVVPGSWSIKVESDGSIELNLNFGDDFPLVNLDDDWDLDEFNNTMIKLMDEDTAQGSSRLLTFEKI